MKINILIAICTINCLNILKRSDTKSSDDFGDLTDGKAEMSIESDKQIISPISLKDEIDPKSSQEIEYQSNSVISEEINYNHKDEPEPALRKMLMYKRMATSEDEDSSSENESENESEVEFDNEDDIEF